MRIFTILFMLGFSLSSMADSYKETLYSGRDQNGQPCEVKIEEQEATIYVLEGVDGRKVSAKPFAGSVKELDSFYVISGMAGGTSVNVHGPLVDLQAALSGKVNTLKRTIGSNLNEGTGKQSMVMKLAHGVPTSVEFKYNYYFMDYKNTVCSDLLKK